MRVQLRIVAGTLKGRKIASHVGPDLRPTPQMVREALFSILGDAVPGSLFADVFAGTGINGLEALSRGASQALFLERDFKLAQAIGHHLRDFGLEDKGKVLKADVYRWAAHWQPGNEPVNVFLSPPFADLHRRVDEFLILVANLQKTIGEKSVLVIQAEKHTLFDQLPRLEEWDARQYGRNMLLIWVKEGKELSREL